MVGPMMIDLKALLVEREDCDAGTVQQIRNGLAQGGSQYRTLRDVTDVLHKKLEAAVGPAQKKWHLKLGIALFFLGHTQEAAEHLKQTEGALAGFYLGRAQTSQQQFDEALKAFERAEKSGYTASQVQLQRAGIYRQKGDIAQARTILNKMGDQATHNAEYHFQLASCFQAEGERGSAVRHLEKAVELDPGHTGALFQLGHANDLAGNDEDAISYYERCLSYPPVHAGVLMNLGVLYEDSEKFDRAVDCYQKLIDADHTNEHARLFLRDAHASLTMYYTPEEEGGTTK